MAGWLKSLFSPFRVKFSCIKAGNCLNSDQHFINRLCERLPGLQETSVEESDVVLMFCPVVSRAGTDIEAALKKISTLPDSKPAVLVLLHQTSDPNYPVPDSSRSVTRDNTLTVDCLYDHTGLLDCQKNQDVLDKVTGWIRNIRALQSEYPSSASESRDKKIKRLEAEVKKLKGEFEKIKEERDKMKLEIQHKIKELDQMKLGFEEKNKVLEASRIQEEEEKKMLELMEETLMSEGSSLAGQSSDCKEPVKFSNVVVGNTLKSHQNFLKSLYEKLPDLEETSVEQCDVILVFCAVVPPRRTNIQTALQQLQDLSDSRPAVLVVLYHTLYTDCTVPDSSRSVTRANTLTVDCLFYEDRGLLHCQRNQDALDTVTNWIKHQVEQQNQLQSRPCRCYLISELKMVEMEPSGEEENQTGTSTDVQQRESEQTEDHVVTGVDTSHQNESKQNDQQQLPDQTPASSGETKESEEQRDVVNSSSQQGETKGGQKRTGGDERIRIFLRDVEQDVWVPKRKILEILRQKTETNTDQQSNTNTTQQPDQTPEQPDDQTPKPPEYQTPKQPEDQTPKQPEDQTPKQPEYQTPKPPEDQTPKQPEYQTPKQPEDQTPKQPEDQTPKQPEYQTPKPPEYQTPKQPEDQTPKQPEDQTPKQPEYQTPKQPEDQTPKQPEDQKTKQPEDQTPKQSEDQTPKQPEDQKTKQPEDQTPKQPEDQTPKQPEDQTPKPPEDQKTKQPEDQTPKQPEDQTPKPPEDQTPKQPEDQTPKQPEDQTPKQPEDQTPKQPEDQTPKQPEDQTPKQPEDQTPKQPEDQTPKQPEDIFFH